MKKQFYRRNKALFSVRMFSFGTAVLAFGFFVLFVRIVTPGIFSFAEVPALRAGTSLSASVATVMNIFADKQALVHKRDSLVLKNTILENENRALTAQVQDLTTLVGTSTKNTYGVVANVLSRPPESPYDTLLIDAGSADAIAVGDSVSAQGGVPVGKISDITSHTAHVVLFSSPAKKTNAWIGTSRTPIILSGDGAGAFSSEVSRQISATVGELVYVSGNGSAPIGVVAKIDNDPAAVTVVLHIRPFVNPFSIMMVNVAR